ncbi:MAG: alkaline phosphatase, partial [Cyanobacteria bacterium P01_G01_bin.49]
YGQPPLNAEPPTVSQMLEAALPILSEDPEGFFVVMEEEGTANCGNNNNAAGTIEAVLRADEAIGTAMDYVRDVDPNTLILTAADSDGGGLEVDDVSGETTGGLGVQPPADNGDDAFAVPYDGQTGNNTEPFVTGAPDANGNTYEFGVAWSGTPDVAGSIVSKAFGMNADLLPSTLDNTEIYRLMYQTLFGVDPEEVAQPQPEPAPTLVTGTSDGDMFDTAVPDSDFVGDNQILFAGSGDDMVDTSTAVGGNRIDLGSGNDLYFAGTSDRVLAGSGDDILFLGTGNGENIVTGDMGADQFWLSIDDEDLPTMASIITDFDAAEGDVFGFGATSLTFGSLGDTWNLRQEGDNTVIEAFGQDLATLSGIASNSLVEANFVFA